MHSMKKMIFSNEKGFALLAAIIACLILMGIGLLVINMSTGDLRSSSRTVGEKKALAGTESGINHVLLNFDPDPATWTAANGYTSAANCAQTAPPYIWRTISSGASAGIDEHTQYAYCRPIDINQSLCRAGDACDFTQVKRYDIRVVGNSTTYGSTNEVDVGLGYRCPKE